jgi:hypothetical protein
VMCKSSVNSEYFVVSSIFLMCVLLRSCALIHECKCYSGYLDS